MDFSDKFRFITRLNIRSQFGLVPFGLAYIAVGLLASSCGELVNNPKSSTQSVRELVSLPVKVLPDQDLFRNNDASIDVKTSRPIVSLVLQREIKQQLLMSLVQSNGYFKEVLAESELTLIELNITRIEHTSTSLNLEGRLGRTEPDTGGQSADAKVEVENSKYNVAFVFLDETLKQVYRFQLDSPLDVQERIKVTASAELAIEPVANLKPKWLASAIAAFFKDINVSVKGGGVWEKQSDITTSLYYRGLNSQGSSEMMNIMTASVLTKLCVTAQSNRKLDTGICNFNLASISDPLVDLKASWQKYKVLSAVRCQDLPSDGFLFDSVLSAPSDGLAQQLEPDDTVTVYLKSSGQVWKRMGEAVVLATNTENDCFKSSSKLECVKVKFAKPVWNNTCRDMNEKGFQFGFSKVYQDLILK